MKNSGLHSPATLWWWLQHWSAEERTGHPGRSPKKITSRLKIINIVTTPGSVPPQSPVIPWGPDPCPQELLPQAVAEQTLDSTDLMHSCNTHTDQNQQHNMRTLESTSRFWIIHLKWIKRTAQNWCIWPLWRWSHPPTKPRRLRRSEQSPPASPVRHTSGSVRITYTEPHTGACYWLTGCGHQKRLRPHWLYLRTGPSVMSSIEKDFLPAPSQWHQFSGHFLCFGCCHVGTRWHQWSVIELS